MTNKPSLISLILLKHSYLNNSHKHNNNYLNRLTHKNPNKMRL